MKCMSPALTKSSVIRHFDIGGALEICHKIIPGLIFVDPDTNQYKDLQSGMVGAPTRVHLLV